MNLGALPLIAIECMTRPVEYSPAFRLDSAAVSTTMFIKSPAPWKPILEKNVTNGLSPAL
ncbi:Uncharacterised protein [Mycobacterium tuberculosis]|uniref:Uncharacterized protein n=1 Tax=Mycobacterium tuberculosis TaxID=1773 RepID=A0A655ANN3_MYCTX|nr:Uncharacterised protein [Mycobacterium tuberculosis]CKS22735.1 Uncharacterised protein [Mycobacterium tuberculosis]CKS41034.1 Uncharacterised protein [Mycobacterium tuberculosis]CKS70007.1 Uncharacterised protein [Mycobacterium tuberculosis]CKT33761.1 Uncharacterised protein [Mycobacterium tuberculosis]